MPIDDCFDAYKFVLQQGVRADRCVFAGDSAGGGLGLYLVCFVTHTHILSLTHATRICIRQVLSVMAAARAAYMHTHTHTTHCI